MKEMEMAVHGGDLRPHGLRLTNTAVRLLYLLYKPTK